MLYKAETEPYGCQLRNRVTQYVSTKYLSNRTVTGVYQNNTQVYQGKKTQREFRRPEINFLHFSFLIQHSNTRLKAIELAKVDR